MTSKSNNTGLPAWFLVVGIGGVAGIVVGAILFFGTGGNTVKPAIPVAQAPAAKATTASNATPSASARPLGGGAKLPTTLEGWKSAIASAKQDSYPAMMDGALAISDPTMRSKVVEALLVTWLNNNCETYLQYLDQLEGADDGSKNLWPILVPAFVKAVPQLGASAASSSELEEAVQWMTDYYAQENPPAALDWAKKWLLGDAQESAFATIAGQLAKTSLDQAVGLANSLKSQNARIDAVSNIGSELGKIDPQKALAWAQSLPDAAEKAAATEEVMWSMADSDPAGAAAQVKQLNNPDLLQNIGGTIAESLADKDPSRAVQWAEAVPAGPAQNEAMSGALSGWAKTDPKAAFSYFQSKQSTNFDAAEGIFEEWAAKTPQDAAAQATSISDPTLREHAVTGVVNGWLTNNDVQGAQQWVDQLPAGHERDVASAAIVDAMSVNDPQTAWDRSLTIQDPQVRQEAVLSALSGLAQSDPEAAQAAVNSAHLTEQEKKLVQPVLNSLSKGQPPPQN